MRPLPRGFGLGDGIAHGIVDGAFADFATLDVRYRNAQRQRDRDRGQHFVAVGDQQQQVRTQAS
jgi:hypothetical protein